MAEIKAQTNEKVFPIKAFLGLNQNPDGDTKLKMGEAAVMDNFRITRDRNLQRRPGTQTVIDLNKADKPIKGLWFGRVGVYGNEYLLGACDGKLYKLWDESEGFAASEIGSISTDKDVYIFAFENKAYILDGSAYWQWEGSGLIKEVEGYRPLVKTSISPINTTDESATLENINRLNGLRRVWLSPDGAGTEYYMPEIPFVRIDYVYDLKDIDSTTGEPRELVYGTDYTVTPDSDGVSRKITFTSVYPASVNRFEVGYTVEKTFRTTVEKMQYAELFAGTQDTRVFLYGDGTNKTIYSGIDYNGNPRADYFPDEYEALVGDENTPITGMIRHYSSLACYKLDSAWSISASSITLANKQAIPVFYVTPVNKAIGSTAPGQVRLVMNSPFTLFGNDLYEWKNSSYYTSNLTRDERQAKRISDRVWAALQGYDTAKCYCYDDNDAQEYYVCYNGDALIYNYAADAWSHYTDFPVSCMANIGEELYIGTPDGKVKHFSSDYMDDDTLEIRCVRIYPDGVTKSFPLPEDLPAFSNVRLGKLAADGSFINPRTPNWHIEIDEETGDPIIVYDYWYDAETNNFVFREAPASDSENNVIGIFITRKPIKAYWESGSMSFNQDYMRKYSAMTWVGVKPESNTELFISAKTDKKICDTKVISTQAYNFDFESFAFDTMQFDDHYDPQMYRQRIKAKKFVFYKLIFSCVNPATRCTVLAADIRVRYTGMAK